MSLTAGSSYTFNPILSEYVNKIGEQQFVGLQILPGLGVNVTAGQFGTLEADQFDPDVIREIAPGAQFPSIDNEFGQDSFRARKYGLDGFIPDEDIRKARESGISDADAIKARILARNLMLGHELRVKNLLYPSSAVFNATAATAAMSSASTATPIANIKAARRRLKLKGFTDNLAVIISEELFDEMLETAEVKSIYQGAGRYPSDEELAAYLRIDRFIVCASAQNTAKKGQTATRAGVWPTDKYLVAQIKGGEISEGGIGRTMYYEELGGLFQASTGYDDDREGTKLRVKQFCDEKLTNTLAGELITGA